MMMMMMMMMSGWGRLTKRRGVTRTPRSEAALARSPTGEWERDTHRRGERDTQKGREEELEGKKLK